LFCGKTRSEKILVLKNSVVAHVQNNLWLTLDAESVIHYPDGVNQIYKGEIDGMLIKGVFSKEEMLKVKYKLESQKDALTLQRRTQGYGQLLGALLVENESDTTKYFQDAAILRDELKKFFESGYEATVEAILTKISGGRTVELARKNAQQVYAPAQIRFVHPNQGGIKLHRGNEFISNPAFDHLRQIAKIKDCLGYYIVIDKPEQGGELFLYDLLPEQTAKDKKYWDLEKSQKRSYNPDIGDLVLFHEGVIWHAISEVKGQKTRITIGGFATLSNDEHKIHYWG
jgi:hypothetical protein